MAEETTPQIRRWIYVGIALIAVIALYLMLRHMFRTVVEVNVGQAAYHNIVSTESTNGQVVPVNDFQANVTAPGSITRLFVTVGQHVEKGQELVQMDDSEELNRLASANSVLIANRSTLANMQAGGTQDERIAQKADLSGAQTQVSHDQEMLIAQQSLLAKGAASANEITAAKQKLQADQTHLAELRSRQTGRYGSIDLATQKAQIATSQQAVSAAQSALSSVNIRAPFSGTVYSEPFSAHDFVQAGEAILNLADLNQLRVKAYFDEPEVGVLKVGQKVSLTWDARPDRTWHGHIDQAPTTIIVYGTRHVGLALISVDDAHGDLLPNINVTVNVTTSEKSHVLSIPREGLHTQGEDNYVFKVVNNHLKKTQVAVGSLNLTLVQITAGLADGDVVALGSAGDSELTDGLEVRVQP
jgi:HlyD family secretion protein